MNEKLIFHPYYENEVIKVQIKIRMNSKEVTLNEYQEALKSKRTEIIPDSKWKPKPITLRTISYVYEMPWSRRVKNEIIIKPKYIFDAINTLNKIGIIEWEPKLKKLYETTISPKVDEDFHPPNQLSKKLNLRNYQISGFLWLKSIYGLNLGAILADEMGLGKTIQAITLIGYSLDKFPKIPFIIICPLSVIYNWEKEIKKYIPTIRIEKFIGYKRNEFFFNPSGAYILLTTYATLRQSIKNILKINFAIAFFDEAQALKNADSITTKTCQKLKCSSKILLTGTPIENNIYELWSLFNCMIPDYLETRKEFRKKYREKDILLKTSPETEELKRKINPFILKRTKKEVLKELPEKLYKDIHPYMTPLQQTLYESVIKKRQKGKLQLKILSDLLKITSHPSTYSDSYAPDFETSGKMIALKEIFETSHDSSLKILVFVRFIKTSKIVKKLAYYCNFSVLKIEGSMKYQERKIIINDFKNLNGPLVLVLTYQSSGLGLNLQPADAVVHFDRWWNPAIEKQAEDRAHRIGRTADVYVYKMHCIGSIDDKIERMQQEKRILIEKLLETKQSSKLIEELLKEYENRPI